MDPKALSTLQTYEDYLANHHGMMMPLSREKWEKTAILPSVLSEDSTIMTNIRCWNCKTSISPTKLQWVNGFDCYTCGAFNQVERNKQQHANNTEKCQHGFMSCIICNFNIRDFTNPKDKFGLKKVPLHLIPSSALARLAIVMQLGEQKYGAYNWREKGVRLTIYLDAAERHLRSILDGESVDAESHMPHAAHVMACMAIILDAFDLGKLVDDRPTPGRFAEIIRELEK